MCGTGDFWLCHSFIEFLVYFLCIACTEVYSSRYSSNSTNNFIELNE